MKWRNLNGQMFSCALAVSGLIFLSWSLVGAQSKELIEAATKEGEVSIIGSLDIETTRRIQDTFEKKYPGIKTSYWRGSGTAIFKKAATEFRADSVYWDVILTATDMMEIMKKEGMFSKYQTPVGEYFEKQYHHEFFSPSYRKMLVGWLYNTKSIKPEDAPKTYEDILDPKWKGKITIPNPAGQAFTAQVLASLHLVLGSKEKEEAYIKGLAANQPILLKSMAPTSAAVASGEVPIALTFIKYVHILGDQGAPLEYVRLPAYLGDVHFIAPGSKAPHPNAAKLWIDHWYSKESMEIMAESGEFVNRPGVYPPLKGADKAKYIQAISRDKNEYKKLQRKYGKMFRK
ncbi:MAG: extracellular solute-binding protein [Deltaproteobacteria bacterium]|nr:extracellular solute-binding protein [Deltaproteobacteria bacterium]